MRVVPLERTTPADAVAEALRDEVLGGLVRRGRRRARATCRPASASRATSRGPRSASSSARGCSCTRCTAGWRSCGSAMDDVRDLFAARRTLELAGLEALVKPAPGRRRLAPGGGPEHDRGRGKAGDGRAAVAADAAFHLAIVASTSSRRLRLAAEAALRELRIVLAFADRVVRRPRRARRRPRRPDGGHRPGAAGVGPRRPAGPPPPRRAARARPVIVSRGCRLQTPRARSVQAFSAATAAGRR